MKRVSLQTDIDQSKHPTKKAFKQANVHKSKNAE